jgi:MFS family permease
VSTSKNYLLALLTIILAFNYIDRIALGLVAQNIKIDLALTDTQLGFLSGIAFALFYSVMGLPIARWADRGNRVTITVLSTALWSASVAACALAQSFFQLMLIRVVVGVGESGCVPPAHSLIADFFTRAQRSRAVAVYMQGISASLIIGYFLAGWLNQFCGWRAMFVLIGLPGLALSVLARFTLRDPRQDVAQKAAQSSRDHLSVKEVCVTLWARPTFRHLLYASSLICFFGYGTLQWVPAFFVRSFGFKTGELGTWFAAIYGLSNAVGAYWSGEWTARRAANNEPLQLNVMALVTCTSGIFMACVFLPALAPNYYWAFGWLALSSAASMFTNAPTLAILQTLVPPHMRAMSVSLLYLFTNLVGLGCGPWATGGLSDALRPWAGDDSLRYAILILCPVAVLGAWYLRRAARAVKLDLSFLEIENAAQADAHQLSSPDIHDNGASMRAQSVR